MAGTIRQLSSILSGKARRALWAAVILFLVGIAVVAHYRVTGQGMTYTGPLLILDHLFLLALVMTLAVVTASVGREALVRLKIGADDRALERLVFATALGFGIIATSILVLGLLSALSTLTVWLVLIVLALLAYRSISEIPSLIRRACAQLSQHAEDRSLNRYGLAVFGIVTAFMILLAMAPPVDWDSLMYHLQVPLEFLDEGRVHVPPDNLHVAFVGLVHMLYIPFLALQAPAATSLLSALMAVALGLAVFSFARRFLNTSAAPLSLALLWGTPSILLVAITPRVDVTLALFLFLSQYALFLALEEAEGGRRYFFLSAVLLGFGFGIKYQAGAYMLALAPLVIWAAFVRRRDTTHALRSLVLYGFVVIAAALPWLLKNWMLFSAPLYPFLARPALEPWLASLYGSVTVPLSVNPEILRLLSTVREPFNLFDVFFAPDRLTVELEGAFYYANPIFLLLPLWIFFWRDRTLNWLLIPGLLYLAVVILPFGTTNLRYLIPAAAPLSLATVQILVKTSQRLPRPSLAGLALVLLSILALIPAARTLYTWSTRTQALEYFVGSSSAESYVVNHVDPSVRIYGLLTTAVNTNLSRDDRVLMLFDARGFYLEPEVIQDNRITNWPLLAPQLPRGACLTRLEISHVILATGSLRYYVSRGMDVELIQWDTFRQFADRCLRPIYEGPGFVVFRSE
jgi:hypothetical protein